MLALFIALMLSLFGLSLGTSIGANRKEPTPTVLDLGWVVLLWGIVFAVPLIHSRWFTLPIWLLTVTVFAAIQASIRYADKHAEPAPDPAQFAGMNPFRKLWERYKLFSIQIGHFQSLLIMAFFYFVIALPFGLGSRLLSDQLNIKTLPDNTGWQERKPLANGLEDARNQY